MGSVTLPESGVVAVDANIHASERRSSIVRFPSIC